ncbi:MAG: phospholipase D-like domain-containing protein [Rhodospirillaceae bacterium]|nr:phospholipase D-like domain-containing protein [Rhodospirillaceae bacterium]
MSEDSGVAAVVTFPNAPSAIAAALPATGVAHAGLVSTEETLRKIADAALSRFTIASPFLNMAGLDASIELFGRTRARSKRLVTRCTDEVQIAIQSRLTQLTDAGVEVLDYYLSTELGFETFHAKIVLADQDLAYVGSANMTLYARRSMELGVLVEGRPAKVIASAVRAMEKISRAVSLHGRD